MRFTLLFITASTLLLHACALVPLQVERGIDGVWRVESLVRDKPSGFDHKGGLYILHQGKLWMVLFEPNEKRMYAVEFGYAIHDSEERKGIDVWKAHEDERRTFEGIFTLEGDRLKLRFSEFGKPRPSAMPLDDGLGGELVVLVREDI